MQDFPNSQKAQLVSDIQIARLSSGFGAPVRPVPRSVRQSHLASCKWQARTPEAPVVTSRERPCLCPHPSAPSPRPLFPVACPYQTWRQFAFGALHCACAVRPVWALGLQPTPPRRYRVKLAVPRVHALLQEHGDELGEPRTSVLPPLTSPHHSCSSPRFLVPATSRSLAQHDSEQSPVRRDSPVPSVGPAH